MCLKKKREARKADERREKEKRKDATHTHIRIDDQHLIMHTLALILEYIVAMPRKLYKMHCIFIPLQLFLLILFIWASSTINHVGRQDIHRKFVV